MTAGLNCRHSRDAQEKRAARSGSRDASVASAELRLLPVLLNARGTQPGEAVAIDGILPREKFLDGQRVTTARFLERQKSAADRGDDFGLAPDHPALGAGRRQIRDRERTAVRPDDVLGPRTMGLSHMNTHITRLL